MRLHDVNTAAVVKVYTPHTGRSARNQQSLHSTSARHVMPLCMPLQALALLHCPQYLLHLSTLRVLCVAPPPGRVKKLVTEPYNPNLLISCSEDGSGG